MSLNKENSKTRKYEALRTALHAIIQFLDDPLVIEIMLNADGRIWVDHIEKGMFFSEITMTPEEGERIIRLLAAAMNAEVNEQSPSLAAKIPGWGARVQASVPPIVTAPIFALRKPAIKVFSLQDYVDKGILTLAEKKYLADAVKSRKNILIGGGTGSGKTTLMNALLHEFAGTEERIYVVEDNIELQCSAENRVEILVQPPLYTHQRAIMDALRCRPDRILIGEVRDGAALDMLKAWNTGHPGGIATIHANSTASMLDRLGQLCEEVMPHAPRYLIGETISICLHIQRDPTHPAGRSITGIMEVIGDNNGRWDLQMPNVLHTHTALNGLVTQ